MEKTISTVVEGMTCGNCALTISKLLERKGMKNVSANAASGEVNFTIEEEADVDKVYDAIDNLGYKVVREDETSSGVGTNTDHTSGRETTLLITCALLTLPLLLHMFSSWHVLHNPWVQFALATPVYLIGCYVFLPSAIRSLMHRLPNMNVLIVLGASAAYIYSLIGLTFFPDQIHNYLFFETTASIITLVMLGNWLEHRTVRSTTVAIDALVQLQPTTARVVMTDSLGRETVMDVDSKYVRNGDVVMINAGDNIPVDGDIIFGEAEIDEHMITGESLPVRKGVDSKVVAGTLVADGNLKVRATAIGSASVLANIIRMVREAQAAKPPLQKLADKISAVFVPTVLVIAIATIVVNYFLVGVTFPEAMMRSIAVMVIACPCAMGLATPAAIAVGLGRAARNGMLIKGGDTLESLKRVKYIVFDKTGTLTTGKLQIEKFVVNEISEDDFKAVITAIEQHSSHPIAKSILAQWGQSGKYEMKEVRELKGKGMEAEDTQGNTWRLGSGRWLNQGGSTAEAGYDLYLYRNNDYKGALKVGDTLREDARDTIAQLNQMGYKTILLSGDKKEKCEAIAAALNIEEVYSEQSPKQKNQKLEELMAIAPTAMVGDGINDAPALARATVGISLSESTQIAIQSADIILSNNQLSTLPKAIRLGIYTEQTIKQNLFWAFFYNIIAIPVAAAGYLTPTWGAGIMALSDVVLVVNSLRLGVRKIS